MNDAKSSPKTTGLMILNLEKVDFKTRKIKNCFKQGLLKYRKHFIMIGSCQQEERTFLNVYASTKNSKIHEVKVKY